MIFDTFNSTIFMLFDNENKVNNRRLFRFKQLHCEERNGYSRPDVRSCYMKFRIIHVRFYTNIEIKNNSQLFCAIFVFHWKQSANVLR